MGNMREVVLNEMGKAGLECVEIRCREVGHKYVKRGLIPTPRRLMIIGLITRRLAVMRFSWRL
jgi:Histone acetyltransferase